MGLKWRGKPHTTAGFINEYRWAQHLNSGFSFNWSRSRRQRVCVLPLGGLGNQLFIIAAGLEQARRLNVPLWVVDQNHDTTARSIVAWIGAEDIYLVSVGRAQLSLSKALASTSFFRKLWFREQSFRYDEEVWNLARGGFLFGYFQSPKYFPQADATVLDRIIESSTKSSANPPLELAVHVRRGDYVAPKAEAKHGLTSKRYYEDALRLVSHPERLDNARVFTDSPELLPGPLKRLPQANSNGDRSDAAAIEALTEMASADTLIISNSTLSWWASRAAQARNPNARVIAPYPWFKDGTSAEDLVPSCWERLPN